MISNQVTFPVGGILRIDRWAQRNHSVKAWHDVADRLERLLAGH